MCAPGHVNTSYNAGPLSRRLPTMRSLLRYRCIVAAAFAPLMPSSRYAISDVLFYVCSRAEVSRKSLMSGSQAKLLTHHRGVGSIFRDPHLSMTDSSNLLLDKMGHRCTHLRTVSRFWRPMDHPVILRP